MEKPLSTTGLGAKRHSYVGKWVSSFKNSTECEVPYNPVIALLGTYSIGTKLVFTQKPIHECL